MFFGVDGVVEAVAVLFLEVFVDGLIKGQRRDNDFLWLDLRVEFLDGGDDFLDLRMAKFEGIDHRLFRDFQRAGFDHDDGFVGTGNDDVHQAFFLVGDGGVDDQLTVEEADADAGDGLLEREIRAVGRGGSAGNGDDVGIILAVRGEDHGDDLSFIAPGLGEERAHGTVDQAGGEDFFFGRTAFALEEATGDFSGGVSVFAIVDSERQKVAVVHLRSHASGGQDDGVAVARSYGAIGLLGDFPGFEDERASSDFDGY
jgi:hypothetical protein